MYFVTECILWLDVFRSGYILWWIPFVAGYWCILSAELSLPQYPEYWSSIITESPPLPCYSDCLCFPASYRQCYNDRVISKTQSSSYTVAGTSLDWARVIHISCLVDWERIQIWSRTIHPPMAPYLHCGAPTKITSSQLERNVQRHVDACTGSYRGTSWWADTVPGLELIRADQPGWKDRLSLALGRVLYIQGYCRVEHGEHRPLLQPAVDPAL